MTININDLATHKELDRKAMDTVRGGWAAYYQAVNQAALKARADNEAYAAYIVDIMENP